MKKLIFFLTVLLFAAVLPAETLYYYSNGRKIELTEDFSSYSFIRTSKTRADFALPEGVKLIKRHESVSIIEVSDENTLKTLQKSGNLFPAYRKKEGGKVHVSNQIFVKIPGVPDTENAQKWCEEHGMKLIKQYKYTPEWYLVSVEENPIKKSADLVDSKITPQAEPDFFINLQKRAYTPNDPLFKNQWHLNNDSSNTSVSGNDHAHVAEAWEVMMAFKGNLGGEGVKLAIIDDGFDLDHEDMEGQFIAGYDFRGKDNDPSYENVGWNSEYYDMHGTCCAGVAAAKADNNKGLVGACPNCKLIPIRIDLTSSMSLSSIGKEAFEWAADAGADIMSNSWGPADGYGEQGAEDMSQPLKDTVTKLVTEGRNGKGIIILFAAGNGEESIETDGFASNPNVFAIGATNAGGNRAYYSDFGKSLDFMAPSCDYSNNGYGDLMDGIWTIDNTGKDGYNTGKASLGDSKGNYTNDFGGTSSACPLAAGITGLVLSANPNLTRDEVYEIYVTTSDKVGDKTYDNTTGFNNYYGYGRINACKAVKKALKKAGEDVSQVVCSGDPETDDPTEPTTEPTDPTEPTTEPTVEPTTEPTEPTEPTDPTNPMCGNGVIDANEICDGNTIPCSNLAGAPANGNAVCAANCMSWDKSGCYDDEPSDDSDTDENENCGNGILDPGEQCDDGNRISGDGCSEQCMKEGTLKRKSSGGCSIDLF